MGDFCFWNDKLVLGCDDSGKSEFLNTRPFKSAHAAPKQSNSNLWFIDPSQLDSFGPLIGRGSVWLRDNVHANTSSDPYLFSGYEHRQLCLTHSTSSPVTFAVEVDKQGTGEWVTMRNITLDPSGTEFVHFSPDETGVWIRLSADRDATGVTAHFQYRDSDERVAKNDPLFSGITTAPNVAATAGVMRSLAFDTLGLVTQDGGFYELNPKMELTRVNAPNEASELTQAVAQPPRHFL